MHPRFPGPPQPSPDFITPPGSLVPQCTRCSELVWDPERHNRSRHPVEGVWRYRATTSDDSEVLVRYHDGRWQGWLPSPVGRWNDDAAIPAWPGTFTPCGGYASGGLVPAGAFPPVPAPDCGYTMSARVVQEIGRGFLDRLNAGEQIPARGAPKTPEFAAAVHEAVRRQSEAETEQRAAATRAALTEVARSNIAAAIDGWPEIRKGAVVEVATAAADAAVDAFVDAVRAGRITHIVSPTGAQPGPPPGILIYDGVEYVPRNEEDR
ncbi:hypothetical protein [Mycolicibacterium porcinum]